MHELAAEIRQHLERPSQTPAPLVRKIQGALLAARTCADDAQATPEQGQRWIQTLREYNAQLRQEDVNGG